MNKKITIISILIILLSLLLSSVTVSSEINDTVTSTSLGFTGIISSTPNIVITYGTDNASELISPNEEEIHIPLNLQYQISGVFAHWHAKKLAKRTDATIELSIIDKPDFCTAEITPKTVKAPITVGLSNATPATLVVSVDENAPAFDDFVIKIGAAAQEIKGRFGLITRVPGINVTGDVRVMADYMPVISVNTEYNYKEIPPLNITRIQFNITNLGNGKTAVSIEVKNASKFKISHVEEIILGSLAEGEDNKETVVIAVQPYKNFSREALQISFTPYYYSDPELKGQTIIDTIVLKNDGSLKEDGIGINASLLIIVVIAVIILILVFTIFFKRKK